VQAIEGTTGDKAKKIHSGFMSWNLGLGIWDLEFGTWNLRPLMAEESVFLTPQISQL
jgi:hypothetical protein